MDLLRIYAYEVAPQRLSQTATPPRGGVFTADESFTASLDQLLAGSKLQSQSAVDFRVSDSHSPDGPSHEVRNLILDVSFGQAAKAKAAAFKLALRLGRSMDDRSPFTLLMLTAYQKAATRRLVLWAFPRDEPFHFSVSGDQARLKILKDAFSRSSFFRKAALFEGVHSKNTFWTGRVIDKHAQKAFGSAADYWVTKFLDCRFSLTEEAGTRLLAKCLRSAYDSVSDQAARDQISNAIVAAHASRRTQWSLKSFANEYLDGEAKQMVLAKAPQETHGTVFPFRKESFEHEVNFRVFRLEDNVLVSAPFSAVGQSVRIEEGRQRTLRCEGTIVEEKVRARHV